MNPIDRELHSLLRMVFNGNDAINEVRSRGSNLVLSTTATATSDEATEIDLVAKGTRGTQEMSRTKGNVRKRRAKWAPARNANINMLIEAKPSDSGTEGNVKAIEEIHAKWSDTRSTAPGPVIIRRSTVNTRRRNTPERSNAVADTTSVLSKLAVGVMLCFGTGLAFAQGSLTSATTPPSPDGIDWQRKYAENGTKLVSDFCAEQGNATAPICSTLRGPCTGFEVSRCVTEELPKLALSNGPVVEESVIQSSRESFRDLAPSLFGWLAAGLSGLWGWLQRNKLGDLRGKLGDVRGALNKIQDFLSDALDRLPNVAKPELTVVGEYNLVLLGTGGVGKTSIVRALAAMSRANPSVASEHLKLYTLASDVSVFKSDGKIIEEGVSPGGGLSRAKVRIKLNIVDTVGQHMARVTDINPLVGDRRTVLVFVIDLFRSVKNVNQDQYKPHIEADRVKDQLTQFSEHVLEFIFHGNKFGKLAGVIVFVNKVDLLDLPMREATDKARNVGQKLAAQIGNTVNIGAVPVIVGSAALGWGVSGFRDNTHKTESYQTLLETAIAMLKG